MKRILLYTALVLFSMGFSQDLENQLLVNYTFSGNTHDESGNNYDATVFGATLTTDRFGHPNAAYYFDGIDDYINFPNVAALKPQLPISFSFWVRYDSTSYQDQTVFNTSFEENHCTGVWFNSTSATSKPAVNYGDGADYYASDTRRTFVTDTVIDTNNWYHMVVILNSATNMRIIVNCKEYGGNYSGTGGEIQYSNLPGCLGRHDRDLTLPPDYFKGYIDDFMMWDRVLTTSEITQLCQQATPLMTVQAEKPKFKIYPNPVGDRLFIETETDLKSFKIFDSIGQVVLSGQFKPEIDVGQIAAGVYFLRCENENGFDVKKIIIK